MKLKPLGDKVIIEPLTEETKTKGGILLPDSAKEESQKGKVVAIGSGKYVDGKRVPLEVKVGDLVWFKKQYGAEGIKIEDKEYYVLEADDILAIIE